MSALFNIMTKVQKPEKRNQMMMAAVWLIREMESEANKGNFTSGEREVFYAAVVEGIQETRRMLPIEGVVPVESRL